MSGRKNGGKSWLSKASYVFFVLILIACLGGLYYVSRQQKVQEQEELEKIVASEKLPEFDKAKVMGQEIDKNQENTIQEMPESPSQSEKAPVASSADHEKESSDVASVPTGEKVPSDAEQPRMKSSEGKADEVDTPAGQSPQDTEDAALTDKQETPQEQTVDQEPSQVEENTGEKSLDEQELNQVQESVQEQEPVQELEPVQEQESVQEQEPVQEQESTQEQKTPEPNQNQSGNEKSSPVQAENDSTVSPQAENTDQVVSDSDAKVQDSAVIILNGSYKNGVLDYWSQLLADQGFSSLYTGNYRGRAEQNTVIYTDNTEEAKAFLDIFPNAEIREGDIRNLFDFSDDAVVPQQLDYYVVIGIADALIS